mgnify:CR=1 FL=1
MRGTWLTDGNSASRFSQPCAEWVRCQVHSNPICIRLSKTVNALYIGYVRFNLFGAPDSVQAQTADGERMIGLAAIITSNP